jgi:uncharacterized protein YraI
MNEIEQNVWRTVRAVTVLAVLVVLLLVAMSLSTAFDLSLGAGVNNRQPYEPVGVGVRVQSYAEIVPGANQTAHAWALGPDQQGNMSSNTIADQQQLSAAAQSAWPRPTVGLIVEGRSGLGAKEAAPTATPAPATMPNPQAGQDATQPRFWVQIPLANLRAGPGTDYTIVGTAMDGQRYPITARYGEWWQVAPGGSLVGALVWVHGALGRVEGDAGAVQSAVLVAAPTAAPIVAAIVAPTTAPTATATRLPFYAYSVEMSRHPEANTVVVYALIQDNQAIVGDLFLSVEHNGQRWRSEPSSYAVQGVTKPSEPGSPYNRTYNAKIDFPLFLFPVLDQTGDWAITLVDGAGQALSVISTVTIAPGDQQREIFLHYRRVKL